MASCLDVALVALLAVVVNIRAEKIILEGSFPYEMVDWNKIAQDDLKATLNLEKNTNKAKNVILYIGDGMGFTTTMAARIYEGQTKGQSGEENLLSFERFPWLGIQKTYAVDAQGVDSAASASALMCGLKTKYATLGTTQKVTFRDCSTGPPNKVDSILDWSKAAGKSVGIVTTTRLTHATPAAAYAHTASRYWEDDTDIPDNQKSTTCKDIARQLIEDNPNINVLLGGGRLRFLPNTTSDAEYPDKKGARADGRNLIQEWQDKKKNAIQKYKYVWNKKEFDSVDPKETDYLLGLFDTSHMQYELDRSNDKGGEPSIAAMVEKAIKILSKNTKGYFLLVEGGRIDHAHHDALVKKALHDTVAFSDAVQKGVDMTNEKDTHIVVTADHSHPFTVGGYPHRGAPILGFDIKLWEKPFDGMPYTIVAYQNGQGPARHNMTGDDTTADNYQFERIVEMKWDTHASEDVPIFARGPLAHLYVGIHEANYVAHVMAYASCVGANQDHCNKDKNEAIATPPPPVCSGSLLQLSGILLLTTVWISIIHN